MEIIQLLLFVSLKTFTSRLKQWTSGGGQQQVLVPEVVPTSPTPLLLTTEENEGKEFTSSPTSSLYPDLRLSIGLSPEDEGMCDDVEMANGEGSGYRQGSLDADESLSSSEVPSGYEKRHGVC